MTEAEWLACDDPDLMLEFILTTASARKIRLYLCAEWHQQRQRFTKRAYRDALEIAERFTSGEADEVDLMAARGRVTEAHWKSMPQPPTAREGWKRHPNRVRAWTRRHLGVLITTPDAQLMHDLLGDASRHLAGRDSKEEERDQCAYLRDIFGNPFRSVPIHDPTWLAWNEDTILKMTQAIYDERAFDRLPILADALEDAGCDNADILAHCRQPGEHVRGCWVVDLLLGKQ